MVQVMGTPIIVVKRENHYGLQMVRKDFLEEVDFVLCLKC